MTLRPEIEALVQGALDGSLSPEDRQTTPRRRSRPTCSPAFERRTIASSNSRVRRKPPEVPP